MTTIPTNIKVSKFVATDAVIRDHLKTNNLRVRNSTTFDHIINCQTLQANRLVVPYTGGTGEVVVNGNLTTTGGITMNNSIASYTPSILNYYEETASVNLNFTGAWTATKTVTLTRIGRIVTAAFATGTSTATSAASLTSEANIPARFRPVATHIVLVQVVNNAATSTTPGNLQVATTGIITVFSNSAAGTFSNSANCGYNSFCTTWQVA